MSKRIFSKGGIAELLKNRHVIRCTPKAITYCADFKIAAVRHYREEGILAKDIFRKAGFDLRVIGPDNAKFRSKFNKSVMRTTTAIASDLLRLLRSSRRPQT